MSSTLILWWRSPPRFGPTSRGYQATPCANVTSERGAVGWLLVGIVVGAVLVVWLIVQIFQALF